MIKNDNCYEILSFIFDNIVLSDFFTLVLIHNFYVYVTILRSKTSTFTNKNCFFSFLFKLIIIIKLLIIKVNFLLLTLTVQD